MSNVDFIKNVGASCVLALQSSTVAGFMGYAFGKVFSKADPMASAAFASKTAGYSALVGLGICSLYDRFATSGNPRDESQERTEKTVLTGMGAVATTLGSFLNHKKQFPLLAAITYTNLGILGSVGALAIYDNAYTSESKLGVEKPLLKIPKPVVDLFWVLQSASAAGMTALLSSDMFEQMNPSSLVKNASIIAGFSMAVGLGVGLLCDKIANHGQDKEKFVFEEKSVIVLGVASVATAGFAKAKGIPLLPSLAFSMVGFLASKVSFEICDKLSIERAGRPNIKEKEGISIIPIISKQLRRKKK